jgi:hypothetical protein
MRENIAVDPREAKNKTGLVPPLIRLFKDAFIFAALLVVHEFTLV